MSGRPDAAEVRVRAASFANTAALYEFGRPTYPPDLLRRVIEPLGSPLRILDLGAGTGKLTRQLVEFGAVVAVEPLAPMREQLRRVLPDVPCLDGSAESIPLPDASVDLVTVGQAYHWFDQQRSNPEIARVLVDGGHLLALWNDEDNTEHWVQRLNEIMHSSVRGDEFDWPARFQAAPWFTEPVLHEGTMRWSTTHQQYLASMESHSYLSSMPVADRQPTLDAVAQLLADFPDPFDVPYGTIAYLCRKLPASAS